MIALRALTRTRLTPGIDWRTIVPTGDAAEYGIFTRIVYGFGAFFALTVHKVSTGQSYPNPYENIYLKVLRSTNGASWTTVATVVTGNSWFLNGNYTMQFQFFDATFSEGMMTFIGTVSQASPFPGGFYQIGCNISSTNGVDWNLAQTLPTGLRKLAYGNGAWLVQKGNVNFSSDAELYRSTDFYTYDLIRAENKSVAFGNGVFVASKTTQKLSYSTDGVTWETNPFFDSLQTPILFFSGGRFWAVVSGTPHRLFYSYDGVYWFESTIPTLNVAGIYYPICCVNNGFIFAGEWFDPVYGTTNRFCFYSKGGSQFIDISQSAKIFSLGLPSDAPFFVNSLGFSNNNKIGISP